MAITDYTGRTVDLWAFSGQAASGVNQLRPTLLHDGGQICTGTMKLAQRFLLELLTEQGSIPYKPTRGSRLLTMVRQGYVQSDLDATAVFNFALGDIESILVAEEAESDPDDERYAGAELLGADFTPGQLILRVNVQSRAGDSRRVILPVNLT